MVEQLDEDSRTVWCGNLSDKITEELLYELFLQAAPLQRVCIPKDKDGKQNNYGFVTFKHSVSVQYAIDLLNGTNVYDRRINIKPRGSNLQRQNSHQNDYQMMNMQKSLNPQINMLDAIHNLNMLMRMGDNMLINNKAHSPQHNNYNQNNMHSSSPYRRMENKNYYDDRREDNRSNYRRHRSNDRHNANHRSYHNRRFDR